ncbi:AI-2E family transporter [Aerococcus suis]|uniref:Predicted PurR-regulated permease PerM n=1 Tax=Aerococcus suis TaxID=371602 RepID=A0A1W1Y7N2_9LACT|nr:AI-2E family transporter [Aerococcus suis]SMC31841.1 Predicted PurR-regulated permease PerM [Aerococcus suis]
MKTTQRTKQIMGIIIAAILLFWAVNNFDAIRNGWNTIFALTLPFILGAGLAFVLNIPLRIFEKYVTKWTGKYRSWYRMLGILFSFLIVTLVLSFLIFLVLPDLQETISSFISIVPQEINKWINWINDFITKNPEIMRVLEEMPLDIETIKSQAINAAQTVAGGAFGSIVVLITGIINSVFNIFVAIVFAVFILSGKETLTRHFKKSIYGLFSLEWANYIINVGKKANEVFSNFISGEVVEAFILGLMFYISMWIFGFPYRLSVSVLTGVMALIPIFGAIIGGAVGAILIAVVSFKQGIWFIVLTVVIQQIEGNVIYPRVVGNSVGLPGIWVMFAVTIGGGLFGFAGMLLSVPTLSLIYQLFQDTINYNLESRGLEVESDSANL